MHLRIYETVPGLIIAIAMAAQLSPAKAQSGASMSGVYDCVYGCRVTEAAPSVQIEGNAAVCANELGGIYQGRLLSRNSLWPIIVVRMLLNSWATPPASLPTVSIFWDEATGPRAPCVRSGRARSKLPRPGCP